MLISKYSVTEADRNGVVTVPQKSGGQTVIGIADRAFAYTGAKEIVLPDTVSYLSEQAFCDIPTLEKISVSDRNPYFTSRNGVLYSKDMTTLIRYPQAKPSLTFTVPSTVTRIAPYAFQGYSRLTSITMPAGLESIGAYAFRDCTGLTKITLPDTTVSVSRAAFD